MFPSYQSFGNLRILFSLTTSLPSVAPMLLSLTREESFPSSAPRRPSPVWFIHTAPTTADQPVSHPHHTNHTKAHLEEFQSNGGRLYTYLRRTLTRISLAYLPYSSQLPPKPIPIIVYGLANQGVKSSCLRGDDDGKASCSVRVPPGPLNKSPTEHIYGTRTDRRRPRRQSVCLGLCARICCLQCLKCVDCVCWFQFVLFSVSADLSRRH